MNVKVNNPFTLGIKRGRSLHYRRRYEPTGCHPMATIPQPAQCWIARMLHGAWLLSSIEGDDAMAEIEFRAPDNHNFVGVQLAAGERVIFNFEYFVGFTGGLKLSTQLTLNVASLALPRVLFQSAEGPGLLLLRARGVPRVWRQDPNIPPFSPARMICWSSTAQFDLRGSARAADIFLSPVYLHTRNAELLIIDTDEPAHSSSNHLWRMIKSFWKPL